MSDTMSLQTKLLCLVSSLTLMLVLAMLGREIEGTRRSVHEEIRTAHRVAGQLLGHLATRPAREAARELAMLGRVRAHDLLLEDAGGRTVYRSPQSPYKAGRTAPRWFAAWVTPTFDDRVFTLPDGGRLLLRADASRAVVDGWDDFIALAQWLAGGLALLGLLCWRLVRRTLAPLARIETALRDIQQGRLDTRLPPLPGREAKLMSQAFNDMAQGLQQTLAAREEARQAQARLQAAQETAVAVQRRIEEERRHIARELHDEMGQQITALRSFGLVIVNRVRGLRAAGPAAMPGDAHPREHAAAHHSLEDVAGMLVDATARLHEALRRIIPRLRPVALDRFGLRDALLDLIADCRLLAPAIRFDARLPATLPDLDDAHRTALYRATQEALNNVIKHADAGQAAVTLTVDDRLIRLVIEDDGRGLPRVRPSSGFGLPGMRERIESLGGSLAFEPARLVANGSDRQGLRVAIALPLPWQRDSA